MQDFYTLIGLTPQYSAGQFVKELPKIGVEEQAAAALTLRPDLFYEQQFLNIQCFEQKLTQTYMVRIQKRAQIKQAFRNLILKDKNVQS